MEVFLGALTIQKYFKARDVLIHDSQYLGRLRSTVNLSSMVHETFSEKQTQSHKDPSPAAMDTYATETC